MVTSAITVNNGDILIVKAVGENSTSRVLGLPTAPGQTFTAWATDLTTSNCSAQIAACVVTGSPGTLVVTQGVSGTSQYASMVVERWTSAQLAGTPAINSTHLASTANGFTGSITTVASNSAVTWCAGDWAANAPGTVGYRSSAVQDGIDNRSSGGNYVGYYATQTAATLGAQTFGLTTPVAAGTWKYLAIEIQDPLGGGTPAIPPLLIMQTRRAY